MVTTRAVKHGEWTDWTPVKVYQGRYAGAQERTCPLTALTLQPSPRHP
jgi:hypothetical protein